MKQLRIHAVPLADDDGGRKYTFTLDNLTKGVARANQALAHADVELVFDPKWDWQPRNDTTLNNEDNSGANWLLLHQPAGEGCGKETARLVGCLATACGIGSCRTPMRRPRGSRRGPVRPSRFRVGESETTVEGAPGNCPILDNGSKRGAEYELNLPRRCGGFRDRAELRRVRRTGSGYRSSLY